MIATCEVCSRRRVPCSGCEVSQRIVCYVCQGDVPDPYAEQERGWLGPVLVGAVLGLLSTWAALCFCVSL